MYLLIFYFIRKCCFFFSFLSSWGLDYIYILLLSLFICIILYTFIIRVVYNEEDSIHMVYIFQLLRYFRANGSFHDFLDRELLQTTKLLNQGFLVVKLKSSLRKGYGRHHDLVNRYGIFVSQITIKFYICCNHNMILPHS